MHAPQRVPASGATNFKHSNSAAASPTPPGKAPASVHRRGSGTTEWPATKGPAAECTYLAGWTALINLMNYLTFWAAT